MQAWHDSISENLSMRSSSDVSTVLSLNFASIQAGQLQNANSLVMAQLSVAKSAFRKTFSPDIFLDNAWFLASHHVLSADMVYELFGEPMLFIQGKMKTAKKRIRLTEIESDSESNLTFLSDGELQETESHAMVQFIPEEVQSKKRKAEAVVPASQMATQEAMIPECTNQVRRSARSNIYDGFKPKIIFDSKKAKSKVKPRKVPAVAQEIDDISIAPPADTQEEIPETPIPVMQAIGINLCGVPREELSPKKLMASLQEENEDEA